MNWPVCLSCVAQLQIAEKADRIP